MAFNESTLRRQEKEQIESICNRRGIQKLVHFTQVSNLDSILEKEALIPVQFLESHVVEVNDTGRFDNHPDSLCLSVEFPNYGMFYKYRQEIRDTNWVVLSIDCSVIWELDCAFYHENAASSTVSTTLASDFKNVESFKAMFRDVEYKGVTVLRDELSIPDHFPTNPQAEVLCFSEIPLRYVNEVICESYGEKQALDKGLEGIPVSQNDSFFRPRVDWKIWKTISRAEKHDPDYMQKLAYWLAQGHKVQLDFDTAANLFLKAARSGVTAAQFNVGLCYEYGHGLDKDIDKARAWLQRAAQNGLSKAKDRLNELRVSGQEHDDLPF